MLILAIDEALRRSLGTAARERAQRCFRRELVTAALLDFYARALSTPG